MFCSRVLLFLIFMHFTKQNFDIGAKPFWVFREKGATSSELPEFGRSQSRGKKQTSFPITRNLNHSFFLPNSSMRGTESSPMQIFTMLHVSIKLLSNKD
jgi:hypothetical protein